MVSKAHDASFQSVSSVTSALCWSTQPAPSSLLTVDDALAVITTRGETKMESVYGRTQMVANSSVRETWMGRFAQLEPEGGFGTVVRQALKHSAPTANGAGPLKSLHGRVQMKPVYGHKCLSAEAGVRETWMDRFATLQPEGGFRPIVERAWSWATPIRDQVTTLAA
jgi:hypothetical protein